MRAPDRTELFRQLERDPILSFIKPKLIGELTGPFHELDFSELRSVLVGTIKRKTTPTQDRKFKARSALPPPEYASSEDSDSTVESPKRMPMRRPPHVMQLAATSAEPEAPSTEGSIPKALEDAIVRLVQSTRMQTAPGTTPPAPRYASPAPTTLRRKRFPKSRRTSRWVAGAGVARVRFSAFSELKDFNGKYASEEKARAWFNRLKSASRCDGMTGDEVGALFGDLMAGPARQWYLQLNRYYHASKHVDATPLEYLYRLNVAVMRAKIRYSGGTSEEKREHVEQFINTLGAQEQELASRLTLMEVTDTATLEKKLHARQHGLSHQKKTLFGSNRFRQKALTPTPTPTRAVHAVQIAADDYDSGHEEDSDDVQICDQDRDDEERTKLFVTGHAPQQENAHRDFETGERREYWKHYAPDKWYKQAKTHGKLNNRKAVLLLDTGAEVSILDTTFSRIRDETYFTVGKMRVKVTLAGNMMYYMDLWVGDLVGQNAIFGVNLMEPAGVRIDTADGTACLPDEIWIQMIGRRPLMVPSLIRVAAGLTFDVSLRQEKNALRLWMTRGTTWVTSVIRAPYDERQNLAYEATSDVNDREVFQESREPVTERRAYARPQKVMHRPEEARKAQAEYMTSGFWVVPMTDRARLISDFVTPFGLVEWLRMSFGLCNAPQVYQRLIDNVLYGFWKLSSTGDTRDVFRDGIPGKPGTRSVLSRRSYIDDILIGRLFKSVQCHVEECVDCETGKDHPTIRGESPGNIVATYPFQAVAMNHIPSISASHKGKTELLIWVDLFTGFVIVKASASRAAQTVAESYEEAVFGRFSASEAIRNDREPGFMSDFFRAFNKLMGQRQRTTLPYCPQANGAAERMVQTITRAIKMYIAAIDQRDWDQYAERLTYALNAAHD
ncbi:Eukaryotic/viral aspartic protease [Phytophthora megakarya]|uniref:Eukaryotic/viral aspartic protease n=1 Tax=Phytophthora megakarya TaxID=4795 RepID=A0A225WE33_9STRA|nr:Eukaryotic/viral aspartic protease [Phytophthora megakarya]